jgi:hypothetical protein
MSYVLHCYSADRVEIASDAGHRFAFHVVPAGRRRHVRIGQAHWRGGEQPSDSFRVLRGALRFAKLCAKDCGLA